MPHLLHLQLGPHAPAQARSWLIATCQDLGCAALAPDAEILVSELTTNVVLHAGTDCDVEADYEDPVLIVTVSDGLPGELNLDAPHPDGEGGRGLLIVDAIARAWGVTPTATGKSVWFALWPPDLATPLRKLAIERFAGVGS